MMGDDLVGRLRRQVELIPGLSPEPPEDDMSASDRLWFTVQEAADEIEALRQVVREATYAVSTDGRHLSTVGDEIRLTPAQSDAVRRALEDT